MSAKKFNNISEYNKFIKKYNVKALKGEKYATQRTKIKHKCLVCGKIRDITPEQIQRDGCTGCMELKTGVSINRTYTLKEVKSSLKELQCKYIMGYSTPFKTRQTILTVKCKCGCIYDANLNQIKLSKNNSCPECTKRNRENLKDNLKLSEKQVQRIINSKFEDKLTISNYKNNCTPCDFKCSKGHKFKISLSSIKRSDRKIGCPVCYSKLTKNQTSQIAIDLITQVEKKSRLSFRYLPKNTEYKVPNTKYQLDAYNEKYNIGIEFHGDYFHGNYDKRLKKYKDTIKRDSILRKKVRLIVVWEGEFKSNPKQTINRCLKQIKKIKSQKL
jgi:hypothetical protein